MVVDYSPSDLWISVCGEGIQVEKKCNITVFEGSTCSFTPPQLQVSLSQASYDVCFAAYLT